MSPFKLLDYAESLGAGFKARTKHTPLILGEKGIYGFPPLGERERYFSEFQPLAKRMAAYYIFRNPNLDHHQIHSVSQEYLWRAIHTFTEQGVPINTYAFGVITNALLNYIKRDTRKRIERTYDLPERSLGDRGKAASKMETSIELEDVLGKIISFHRSNPSKLTEDHVLSVLLINYMDLTHEQASKTLGRARQYTVRLLPKALEIIKRAKIL